MRFGRGATVRGVLARLLIVSALLCVGMTMAGSVPAHAVSKQRVKEVQGHLKRLGMDIAVDGAEGPRTRQAICGARRLLRYGKVTRQPIRWKDVRKVRAAKRWKAPRQGKTYLAVDRKCQLLYQAKHGKFKRVLHASTGARGNATPGGSYKITWRWPGWHDSSEYPQRRGQRQHVQRDVLQGRRGLRCTASRSVPTSPASHGCVRITVPAAKVLYNDVANGTKVSIFGSY